MSDFLRLAKEYEAKLIENRRWLHRNPELGMVLPKTYEYVKQKLEEIGCNVETYCQYGMSVTFGKGDECILVRADMDALPMDEESDLPFASTNGLCHSCGHDIHTALLLTVARILKDKESELRGCIKLMFQPGEENSNGAQKMIDAGVLEKPKAVAAMALHVRPNYENGTFHYIEGTASSSIDVFTIDLSGEAAHGSTPEKAIDPLFAAANIYMALNGLVGREISAFRTAVLSIGVLGGGTAANVIPETAHLKGTVRCYDDIDRQRIIKRMKTIVRCESEMSETRYNFDMSSTPSCYNDPNFCREILPVFSEILGEEAIIKEELPDPSSEDFAFISKRIPSMLFWYGVGSESNYPLHNPKVIMEEDSLYKAAAAMAEAAFLWANKHLA